MPKIRNIIIFITIGIALALLYFFFIKKSPIEDSLVSSPQSVLFDGNDPGLDIKIQNESSQVAKDFLVLLLNVKNIKLDDTILSHEAFTSLHDSSITLTPDATTGRQNPFAKFGNDLPVAGVAVLVAGPSSSTLPSTSGTGTPTPIIPALIKP